MDSPPDFSDNEIDLIRDIVHKRYQKDVELHLADSEVKLDGRSEVLISCPTVFWHQRNCNFVILKVADEKFRTQFFYTPDEHYKTAISEYQDLTQCVQALLQSQSDHERERAGCAASGTTARDI